MSQQHDDGPQEPGRAGAAGPIDITPVHDVPADVAHPADGDPDRAAGSDTSSRRRATPIRKVALGALVAVGLAGAALLGTTGWRIMQQKDAALRPPETVSGLTLDESADAAEVVDSLRTALAAGIDLDSTVAAVYADPAADGRSVFLFGGTGLLFSPAKELEEVLRLLGEQGAGATGMRDVAPGDLGGVMKCGRINVPDGTMSACGWADHGSLAVAMFPGREVVDAATLMRDLRQAALTRG